MTSGALLVSAIPRKSPEKPELPEQTGLRQNKTVLTFKEALGTSDLWWSFIFRGQSKLERASSRYLDRTTGSRFDGRKVLRIAVGVNRKGTWVGCGSNL